MVSVLPLPVAVTVPPPVAENAGLAPVLAVIVPVKFVVAPVLELSETPVPVSLIVPPMVVVPPVRPLTSTEWPVLALTLALAKSSVPEPPLMSIPSPPAPEIDTAVVPPTVASPTPVAAIPSPLVLDTLTPSTSVFSAERRSRRRRSC